MTYTPIGAGSSFNREAEIEEIFASLGMSSTKGYKPIGSVGAVTQAPRNLQPFMPETPQILKSKDDNFWGQFSKGLLSPVTDTLSGFGVIKPRDMPTGVAGILGNLAGSIVGWTALTVLTAGIGTKVGLVGSAAAKVAGTAATVGKGVAGLSKGLLTAKAGALIAKGAVGGGLAQAHWAFGQQEYENIPKEFLMGALTGGVFAGIGSKIGDVMNKHGLFGRTSRSLLDKAKEKLGARMVTVDDPAEFSLALRSLGGPEGVEVRKILNASFLDDQAKTVIKSATADIRTNVKGWRKTQLDILDVLDGVNTKGELEDALRNLGRKLKTVSKSDTTKEKANALNTLFNTIKKEKDGYITRAFDSEAGVRLASLRSIMDPEKAKGQLTAVKAEFERDLPNYWRKEIGGKYKVGHIVDFGDDIENFLTKVGKDTGVNYRPNLNNIHDSSFLKGKAAHFRPEWDDLMKGFDSRSMTVIPTGSVAFGVHSPIKDGDFVKYIKELKELPETASKVGLSLHDKYILQSPVGYLSTKLAPLRAIMGEDSFRMVRDASQRHTVYSNKLHQQVTAVAHKYGYTSHKLRMEHGGAIGDVIERVLPDSAKIKSSYTNAGKKIVEYLNRSGDIDEKKLFSYLMDNKELRLRQDEVKEIIAGITKITTSPDNLKIMEKLAAKGRIKVNGVAKAVDDLKADIAMDFIHNAKLKQVPRLNKQQLSALAKSMGTTEEYLKAASDGRKLLDKLFVSSEIDPAMYRAAYLPHYRTFEGASYKVALKEFQDITRDTKTIKSVFWANELSRSGDMATYDNNFFTAVNRYITGMSKKKHFEPVFDTVNKTLKNTKVDSSRTQVWEQLKRTIQGIPTDMETGFDNAFHNFAVFLGGESDTVMNTKTIGAMLAELQYSAGMGFNPYMPIRNLTQKALALSSISESGNPIEGLYWMGKFKMAKAAGDPEAMKWLKLNDIISNRVYTEGLELQGNGILKVAKIMGMSDMAASRMDDVMVRKAMAMFKWSDVSNVEDTFGAQAMYLNSKGYSLPDILEMSRATTMATQFMYGIDSPMLYKNPFGKQIGLFQSWPLNWAQMLWEQGTQGNMHRAASTIVTMAVASELLSMTGISFRSIHPTETVQGILPLKMLEGEQSWPLAFRVTASTLDYMRGLANGDTDAVDTALNNFLRNAEGLVPFGAVTNRTLKFVDRVRHDWVDYADTGFMHTNSLAPQTRENTSRLVRILGETPEEGRTEALLGLFGTTTKSVQRMEDAEFVKKMSDSYARTRRIAIQAFIDGDYDHFQRMQESLVLNFGRWIEPKDIKQELQYMAMTARERQTRSLPADLEEAFYMDIADPRSINFIR